MIIRYHRMLFSYVLLIKYMPNQFGISGHGHLTWKHKLERMCSVCEMICMSQVIQQSFGVLVACCRSGLGF